MSDDRALQIASEILRERDPAVLAAILEYTVAMDQTFLMAVCQYIERTEIALNGLTEDRHYSLSELKEMDQMPALYNEVLQRLKVVAPRRPVTQKPWKEPT